MASIVWLVTGCSSGFGEQFVNSILARGDKVIATARSIDNIKHLEQSGVSIFQLDICDSQDILNSKIKEATAIYGKIDVLVNNAGNGVAGTWEDLQ
jgi:NADP-dependent 3-hydroxy acid dehydrogenase YdfG